MRTEIRPHPDHGRPRAPSRPRNRPCRRADGMPYSGAAAMKRVRSTVDMSPVRMACNKVKVSIRGAPRPPQWIGSRTYHAFSGISAFHSSISYKSHPHRSNVWEWLYCVWAACLSGCGAADWGHGCWCIGEVIARSSPPCVV